MPIPKPNQNEEKNEFLSRCISFLIDEGKSQDEAAAICYDQWRSFFEGKSMKKTFEIKNVPILKTGSFTDANGKKVRFDDKDLEEIVKNTNALIETNLHTPPLKLGHNESQSITDGLPAIGWVAKLTKIGNQVFAHLKDIPKKVYELIQNRAYAKVSSELYEDLEIDNQKIKGFTLRALALLGADIPAIKGLGDIQTLYAEGLVPTILTFAEQDLSEANELKQNEQEGSMKWTLERVEKSLPCCVEAVKSFMEEKKISEIEVEDLVQIIANVKFAERQKQEREQELTSKANEKLTAESLKAFADEFKKLAAEKINEIKVKLQDERPPKGWFDDCVASVPADITDPEALCAWIYYYWMGPERKAEIEATRASEQQQERTKEEQKLLAEKLEAERKQKEAEEKLKLAEQQAVKDKIKKIIDENRNVFLPKLDPYLTSLSEAISSLDNVIKFSEKEEKVADVFANFLKELAESKVVIFEELAKTNDAEKYDKMISDEVAQVKENLKKKYTEIAESQPGLSFNEKDLDVVALATVLSQKENIGFADAMKKARERVK